MNMNSEEKTTTIYRVSVWTSVDVEADCEIDAEDMVYDMLIGCSIKPREFSIDVIDVIDYEVEAEETNEDIIDS